MSGTIIGIDTGGTYTDAVVCDSITHEIYATAKALTTHDDLTRGIHSALGALPENLLTDVEMVSLSTTLATNACVENKGCRALLILFGTEPETVRKYGLKHGQFEEKDVWCIETDTQTDGTILKKPDWDAFASELKVRIAGYEACAVAEIYAAKTGAVLERKAREIIQQISGMPVACGHELFTELNVLKRGANALLNARLIPIICMFLDAIRTSLTDLSIDAPVMIVRSDGTLMSADYARTHPIETLLCGPAASAMGACALTGMESAMIADIGGTTSDVAFIDGREPEEVNGTVRIGGWNTFLHGIFIETFALGGDTVVEYTPFRSSPMEPDIPEAPAVPRLGTERVIPSCILGAQYPDILKELTALSSPARRASGTSSAYEYLVLMRDNLIRDEYTEREWKVLNLLKERPLTISQINTALNISRFSFDPARLLKMGVIERSGLTPTDVMHVRGDFTEYSVAASEAVLSYAAYSMRMRKEDLSDEIMRLSCFRIYRNLSHILMEKEIPGLREGRFDTALIDRILEKNWTEGNDLLHMPVYTDKPLIGIGGPAAVFVPPVAHALHTKAVIPEHAEVANALGAALGHVAFRIHVFVNYVYKLTEEEKKAQKDTAVAAGFLVNGKGFAKQFPASEKEEALLFAREAARKLAAGEAVLRGLKGDPVIEESVESEYLVSPAMPDRISVNLFVHD